MFIIDNKFKEEIKKLYSEYQINCINKLTNKSKMDLFRDKNLLFYASEYGNNPHIVIKKLLNNIICMSKETYYGEFLEKIALYIAKTYLNGTKSQHSGIDIEFIKWGSPFFVSIKSSPKWSNKNSLTGLINSCNKIDKSLNLLGTACFIDGCCTGRTPFIVKKERKNNVLLKLCGKEFWQLLTDDKNFYYKLYNDIELLFDNNFDVDISQFSNILNDFLVNGKINYVLLAKYVDTQRYDNSIDNMFDMFYNQL